MRALPSAAYAQHLLDTANPDNSTFRNDKVHVFATDRLTSVRASDGSYRKNLLYDADGRVRAVGMAVVAALGYTYDAFGKVHTQQESGSAPITFGYDGQRRLTSAYDQSYAYDSAGRMLLFEGGSNFTFDGLHPHAVNRVNGVDWYDYDANGNLTVRNRGLAASQVLTWTADNRLATVQSSTLTERYAYAPDGERIWKETNGAVTRTPFAHYEVAVASNTVTRYYYFGGQLIAMRQGSAQPTYLHTDALGSVVAASPVGGTSALQRYCGYGRLRSAGSGGSWNCGAAANLFATARTYTGQQADGTGLMYYHARYYDPAAGQFISPDTLVPDPTNVMDYQRYAYARGNPLRYSDPTGHFSEDDIPLLCVD